MLNDMTNIHDDTVNKMLKEHDEKIVTDILRWENGELSQMDEITLMQKINDTGNPAQYGESIKQRVLTLRAQGIITDKGVTKHLTVKDSTNTTQPGNLNGRVVKTTGIRATSNRSIIERFIHQTKSAKVRHLSIKIAGTKAQNHLYSYDTPIARFYQSMDGTKYLLIDSDKKSKTTEVHKNILKRSADSQKIPYINISFTQPFQTALEKQFRTNDIEIEKQSTLSAKARKALRREKFETELRKHNEQNTRLRMLQTETDPLSIKEATTAKDISNQTTI